MDVFGFVASLPFFENTNKKAQQQIAIAKATPPISMALDFPTFPPCDSGARSESLPSPFISLISVIFNPFILKKAILDFKR
jgi:hypothetical protein